MVILTVISLTTSLSRLLPIFIDYISSCELSLTFMVFSPFSLDISIFLIDLKKYLHNSSSVLFLAHLFLFFTFNVFIVVNFKFIFGKPFLILRSDIFTYVLIYFLNSFIFSLNNPDECQFWGRSVA